MPVRGLTVRWRPVHRINPGLVSRPSPSAEQRWGMSPDPALLLARCTVTPSGALRLPWRIVLRPSDPKPRKINVVVVLRFRGLAKALRRHILTGTVPRGAAG